MGKIVISENVSLDGVIQDPTGEEGFRRGGWFSQFGGQGPRGVGQGRVRRGAGRRGPAARPAQLTSGSPRGGRPGPASGRTG